VSSIVGFGIASELAKKHVDAGDDRIRVLRDRLQQGLLDTCPDPVINGDPLNRIPNTLNISFEYIEGEAILLRLNEFNICASSGSACTSGGDEPSHVLRSMGVPFTAIHGSVRFSLSRYTTVEDIDFVLEKMPPIIRELRELSPYGRDTHDERAT
jgi:cysteine desulfurase